MNVKVSDDGKFLQLTDFTHLELQQTNHSFRKRISGWKWHPLVKNKRWDGYIKYIDRYNRIPSGLWYELKEMCKKYDFDFNISGFENIVDFNFDKLDFLTFVKKYFNDTEIVPRNYQLKAALNILKFKKSASEIATSAGKTLIIFIVFIYLLQKKKIRKFLVIVPNTNLILQTVESFEEYNLGKLNYKVQMIHGGTTKRKEDVDIVIGTYQSLVKRKADWFDEFDVVCVDEAHHTHAQSIKEILTKCNNAFYTFGLSGTLKAQKDTAESFTIQAYLGPIVNDISAKFLIDNNYATPVKVKCIILNYLNEEIREKLQALRNRKYEFEGSKLLDIEKKVVIQHRKRFIYTTKIITKTKRNSLILFSDVKHGYGRQIYNHLKNTTNDEIFYIDGGTSTKLREEYFDKMKTGTNKKLVASFGTLSTGISINNIFYIFLMESYKSDRIIRQTIGRGMRLYETKNEVNIIDFIDDYSYNDDNYLLAHGKERMKTYKNQEFPYEVINIDF